MSYLDSDEFLKKAQVFRKRADRQRQSFQRAVFDAETAETESTASPVDFKNKLSEVTED